MSVAVWVFGYGSLIFRADFPFCERRVARLTGFARRFWQPSPDHRGTPEAPGRVVTLIADPKASVLGIAYRLCEGSSEQVLEELDRRERAGYSRRELSVELVDAPAGRVRAFVYSADYGRLGHAEPSNAEIAAIVRAARGPSGDNASYVRRLAAALRELGDTDAHVFEIERLLDEPQ